MNHPATSPLEILDNGRIRVGAGIRVLPTASAPAAVSDSGRIRTGAGIRLLPAGNR